MGEGDLGVGDSSPRVIQVPAFACYVSQVQGKVFGIVACCLLSLDSRGIVAYG